MRLDQFSVQRASWQAAWITVRRRLPRRGHLAAYWPHQL